VTPTLSWSPSSERWGPVRYAVSLDGTQIAQTTATTAGIPTALFPLGLSQGRHRWIVTATNPAGQSRTDAAATVFVDTIAPKVRLKLSRKRTLASILHLTVSDTDSPPGTPPGAASGIKELRVKWGDGRSARYGLAAGRSHLYAAARSYRITVTATDRAGNRTTVAVRIRIRKPVKKHKAKHAHR
jgi:hypothetical protein